MIATTRTIARIPHINTFLSDHPRAVAGWGRKSSGARAIWIARALRRSFVLLEDGFVRSVERGAPSLSLLVDDLGVYYDASAPSRMEAAIIAGIDDRQTARAHALAGAWRASGISKYNHAPDYNGHLSRRYVLVADQTFGDLSIAGGLADETSFKTMLAAAIAENPDHLVLVKVHPDVLQGRKRGYLAAETLQHPNVRVIGTDCHPSRLLSNAAAVYAVTSLMGFEALLWGKPVRCFGMPFYAGWGLTQDELPRPGRRHEARLEDLVHAAFISVACYVDPATGDVWQAEQAIDHVASTRKALFDSVSTIGAGSE